MQMIGFHTYGLATSRSPQYIKTFIARACALMLATVVLMLVHLDILGNTECVNYPLIVISWMIRGSVESEEDSKSIRG